jgi:uncharacterized protein
MHNQNFEWDSDKRHAMIAPVRRGFDQATKAVRDAFAIEAIDEREDYGEERVNLIGVCDGTLLHVTYTVKASGSSQPGGHRT